MVCGFRAVGRGILVDFQPRERGHRASASRREPGDGSRRSTGIPEPDAALGLDLLQIGAAIRSEDERHGVTPPMARRRRSPPSSCFRALRVPFGLINSGGHVLALALRLDHPDELGSSEQGVIGWAALRRPFGDGHVPPLRWRTPAANAVAWCRPPSRDPAAADRSGARVSASSRSICLGGFLTPRYQRDDLRLRSSVRLRLWSDARRAAISALAASVSCASCSQTARSSVSRVRRSWIVSLSRPASSASRRARSAASSLAASVPERLDLCLKRRARVFRLRLAA